MSANVLPEGLDTFPKLLARNAKQWANVPAYREKEYGIWQSWSWSQVAEEVNALAMGYVAETTEEEFLADVQCQDAVIRRLEVMGEASRRVSEETMRAMPGVPWAEMIGMRNVMIHRYDDVDLKIVWDSVRQALPDVVTSIEAHLQGGGG